MWERVYIPAFEAAAGEPDLAAPRQATGHGPRAGGRRRRPEARQARQLHPHRQHGRAPWKWRAWLDERGFAWDYPAAMWERVYIPGFEAWQQANQTSLSTSSNGHGPRAGGRRRRPEARQARQHIRTGNTAVPPSGAHGLMSAASHGTTRRRCGSASTSRALRRGSRRTKPRSCTSSLGHGPRTGGRRRRPEARPAVAASAPQHGRARQWPVARRAQLPVAHQVPRDTRAAPASGSRSSCRRRRRRSRGRRSPRRSRRSTGRAVRPRVRVARGAGGALPGRPGATVINARYTRAHPLSSCLRVNV